MAEHRRIPELEQLEARDTAAVLGVPCIAPPVHLAAPHGPVAPQVAGLAPATQAVAGESPATREVVAPIAAGESSHPFTAVWQQSADAIISSDPLAAWAQLPTLRADVATNGVTAPAHEACAAATAAPSSQQTPTITGVLRYAWSSVNRYRIEDREDAVQQVCMEWLLLAATVATTYDDVRRIVARVLNRVYRRLKKQELAFELLDVPVQTDAVQDAFRDMQLDRDLGMNDLTDRAWRVVQMRRQGCTFAEIGLELGMRRQRARDLFAAAVSTLRRRYRKSLLA